MICQVKASYKSDLHFARKCCTFAQSERMKQLIVTISPKRVAIICRGQPQAQKGTFEEDLARQEKIELTPRRTVNEEAAKRAEETCLEDIDC